MTILLLFAGLASAMVVSDLSPVRAGGCSEAITLSRIHAIQHNERVHQLMLKSRFAANCSVGVRGDWVEA